MLVSQLCQSGNWVSCLPGNAIGAAESRNSIALVNYRALYPFEARNHDEMSFNTGDVIQVRVTLHI